MVRRNLFATSVLVSSAMVGWAAAPAVAQQTQASSDDSVEHVVVTAQTTEQNIIDVPINIAVADQAKLDLFGTDDIEEFADFVPGLQVQAQSLNSSSYNLRGVTSDGGRPRVAVFENGVSIGNPRQGANTAMFDLERIEVVKGPQATLFGQGALVGGINFLQNAASTAGNEGWARVEGGDFGYLRAEAGYNFAISDSMAVRAAALVKNRDGYAPNVSNSPDLMGQDTTALRLVGAWKPSDALNVDLFLNYEDDSSTGTQYKSAVFAPPGGDTSPFTPAANNITPDQMRGKLGADRDLFSATLRIKWTLNDAWALTSISGERSIQNLEAIDSDGAYFSLLQFTTDDSAQQWSQELRFNYDGGGPLTGFFGANYMRLDSSSLLRLSTDESRAQAFLAPTIVAGVNKALGTTFTVPTFKAYLQSRGVPNAANFDNVLNPLPFSIVALLQGLQVPLFSGHIEDGFSNNDQENYDLFGDATWRFTDKLSATGGVRVNWDKVYSDTTNYLVRGNPALGGARNAVTGGTTLVALDTRGAPFKRSYEADPELTWRFNLAYKLTPNINTWAALGRGRRPPALSQNTTATPPTFDVVDPETYDNVEAGLSGFFLDNRLRLTTSAYYGEYKDFQTQRFDVSRGSFVVQNSGNATTHGLELDSKFVATDDITLFFTYANTFAQYDDTDSSGARQAFAGHKFRLTPRSSFALAANLHWPAFGGQVSVVPAYTWKDDMFFEDDNDPAESQKAYGVLDYRLGWNAADGRFGLTAFITNVADKDYLIDGGNTGGDFGIPTYIRGVPRMWGVGANVRF